MPARGAEKWTFLKTANFEMFTTAGENKGREALLYFEQVRSFFQKTAGTKNATPLPVRIIGFQSDKEYKPFRANEFATAYYQSGRDRDYIVMQTISSEYYPVAVHEYTHLLVQHSGLRLPPWMNEGLAELYSTLKPYGAKVRMGDVIPGRLRTIREDKWLPLEDLLEVDHKSPY